MRRLRRVPVIGGISIYFGLSAITRPASAEVCYVFDRYDIFYEYLRFAFILEADAPEHAHYHIIFDEISVSFVYLREDYRIYDPVEILKGHPCHLLRLPRDHGPDAAYHACHDDGIPVLEGRGVDHHAVSIISLGGKFLTASGELGCAGARVVSYESSVFIERMSRKIHSQHLLLHCKLGVLAEVRYFRELGTCYCFISKILELEQAYLRSAPLLCLLLSPLYGIITHSHQLGSVRIYIIESAGSYQRFYCFSVELACVYSLNELVYIMRTLNRLAAFDNCFDYALAHVLDRKHAESDAAVFC